MAVQVFDCSSFYCGACGKKMMSASRIWLNLLQKLLKYFNEPPLLCVGCSRKELKKQEVKK
jgi:hypothetical protein